MGELLQSGVEEEGGHGVNRHEHPDRHDISPEIVITSVDTVKANEEGSVQVHGTEMVQVQVYNSLNTYRPDTDCFGNTSTLHATTFDLTHKFEIKTCEG